MHYATVALLATLEELESEEMNKYVKRQMLSKKVNTKYF